MRILTEELTASYIGRKTTCWLIHESAVLSRGEKTIPLFIRKLLCSSTLVIRHSKTLLDTNLPPTIYKKKTTFSDWEYCGFFPRYTYGILIVGVTTIDASCLAQVTLLVTCPHSTDRPLSRRISIVNSLVT